ncbi:hypothetical protein NC651_034921 [Populus alba x Populus x berolinensis]|nr:hypothetical protein NC651_034921 [Populus alba x Populus x berolinensis]
MASKVVLHPLHDRPTHLNPSLQNEIENENLGLPEKDIGSQGPRKKIVKKGFHGRLLHLLEMKWKNGILVSKSEEGVEFHIGDGYLCPALSKAVKTMRKDRAIMAMKKGEHAAVTVDTEYLRGGDGASRKFLASL